MGLVADGRLAEDTFPKLLLRNARRFAGRPAMREKDLGIWQVWTWARMRDEIAAFSMGLSRLGLVRGDKVAIVGDNRPRLYWTMCAAQALGAIPVPVYQDSVAAEMGFVLDHAGVRFAVVENQEQVDKVLEIRENGPNGIAAIEHVIYDDDRGLQKYAVEGLQSFEAVQLFAVVAGRAAFGAPDEMGVGAAAQSDGVDWLVLREHERIRNGPGDPLRDQSVLPLPCRSVLRATPVDRGWRQRRLGRHGVRDYEPDLRQATSGHQARLAWPVRHRL